MLGLSSALAAALATSAFGLTQNTIWQLADALDLWRLALAALGSIASPVVWLIADHELWERRSGRAARLGQPIRLYAITIVITVTLGVASLYGALLVLNFLASEILIADEILADTLGIRPGCASMRCWPGPRPRRPWSAAPSARAWRMTRPSAGPPTATGRRNGAASRSSSSTSLAGAGSSEPKLVVPPR